MIDKLFVIKRVGVLDGVAAEHGWVQLWNHNPELCYMTHMNGGKTAFEKRRRTGLTWAKKTVFEVEEVEYDNNPISGFRFHDYSSRSTTDNKWVQVRDPRGFVVEISVKSCLELLQHVTVSQGLIREALRWDRDGNSWKLVVS